MPANLAGRRSPARSASDLYEHYLRQERMSDQPTGPQPDVSRISAYVP